MTKRRALIVPAIAVGVVLMVIGVVYWVDAASSLPSFFPGHESATTHHHHVKHGIAAFLLGIACLVFAWFQTGPSGPTRSRTA